VVGAVVAAGGISYMTGDDSKTSTAPKPLPTNPKPAGASTKPTTQAGSQKKTAPVKSVVTETPTTTKVARTSKLGGFGQAFKQARQARLSGKAGDTFQYGGKMYTSYQKGEQPKAQAPAASTMTADSEKAIADFEAKLRAAGVVSIAGGAGGKAQMVPHPALSAAQLEEQFKNKKGQK